MKKFPLPAFVIFVSLAILIVLLSFSTIDLKKPNVYYVKYQDGGHGILDTYSYCEMKVETVTCVTSDGYVYSVSGVKSLEKIH